MRTVITPTTLGSASCEFVEYLHATREAERIALARQIHDDLGGFLVSAAIDLGWTESHPPGADSFARLRRIGASLAGAIALKRNMIEQLRPTLLDNFGLFEALRWYLKHACQRTDVVCVSDFPSDEVNLPPQNLSNIYRATQTLLDCTFSEDQLKSVNVEAKVLGRALSIKIGHEHVATETVDVIDRFRNELTSCAHRIETCTGEIGFDRNEKGLEFYLNVPF
jgi:signal transduction histidine kinase